MVRWAAHLADGPVKLLLEGRPVLARHLRPEPARVGLGALKHLMGDGQLMFGALEPLSTEEGSRTDDLGPCRTAAPQLLTGP